MGNAITSLISKSINEIMESEESSMSIVVKSGAEAFTGKDFDKAEQCLKEAMFRRHAMETVSGIRSMWMELSELETFIDECEKELEIRIQLEEIVHTFEAQEKLYAGTEILMKLLMQFGAAAFQQLNFERVHRICKHAGNLQRFQKRVYGIWGQSANPSRNPLEGELVAA